MYLWNSCDTHIRVLHNPSVRMFHHKTNQLSEILHSLEQHIADLN